MKLVIYNSPDDADLKWWLALKVPIGNLSVW